jgi:selenium metabolism protein YedF
MPGGFPVLSLSSRPKRLFRRSRRVLSPCSWTGPRPEKTCSGSPGTSDRLGTGDERLGEILMKAFLNTLWDNEPKPAKLMFINDGVRLTTEGSEVLDTLRLLEKDGVEIFSCGTCLEYYKLKDDLRVGKVTNMYETVHSLMDAGKVIKI